MTTVGMEPATFQFEAQHLSHCATAVPVRINIYLKRMIFYSIKVSNTLLHILLRRAQKVTRYSVVYSNLDPGAIAYFLF